MFGLTTPSQIVIFTTFSKYDMIKFGCILTDAVYVDLLAATNPFHHMPILDSSNSAANKDMMSNTWGYNYS